MDWREAALDNISDEAYPIHCADCEYILTGLGDTGNCPECGTAFDRRLRLWLEYGPEAFVQRKSGRRRRGPRFIELFGWSAWTALSFVVAFGLSWILFGGVEICSGTAIWVGLLSIERFFKKTETHE